MLFNKSHKLFHLSNSFHISLCFSSCFNHSSSSNNLQSSLTQQAASDRYDLLKPNKNPVSYALFLKIMKGKEYNGRVNIKFSLSSISNEFFLDYAGSHINSLSVNGTNVAFNTLSSLRKGRFFYPPSNLLQKGENNLSISFANAYGRGGYGLHSYIDIDQKQYIYSHSEPYHANKIFPCFDQPDIKGNFKLSVAAPKDWLVASNEVVDDSPKSSQEAFIDLSEYNIHHFKETPPVSTYLYAVIAGPYSQIKASNTYNNIPMSLYCRQSLSTHLEKQAPMIFDVTNQALKFYENYFQFKYPFSKYDHAFCPEYNIGAMENPGLVTFNDRYVFEEEVLREVRTALATTIAHEASHMWFGDLVTMKWWNDLWLKESFADYIAYFCLSQVDLKQWDFENSWGRLFKRKEWAYLEDQFRTTHPIAAVVANTEQAETAFNGIVYAKGAAVLKQLFCLIGKERFGQAAAKYFQKHAWGTATLDDFIEALKVMYQPQDSSYPSSFQVWQQSWLETPGLNSCRPIWKRDTGEIIVEQTSEHQIETLRYHKMKFALFDSEARVIQAQDIVLQNKKQTLVKYTSSASLPVAMLLNYEDEAYIKVKLDQVSMQFFRNNLHKVEESLTKGLIWRAFWDMVRDGEYSSREFVKMACEMLPRELDETTLSSILKYTDGTIKEYIPIRYREEAYAFVFEAVLELLTKTENSKTNLVIMLRQWLIANAEKQEHIKTVMKWFNKDLPELVHIEPGLKNKWEIVKLAHRNKSLTKEQKLEIFNKVAESDPTDTKILVRKTCDALLADSAKLRELWEGYVKGSSEESVKVIAESMAGWNDVCRIEELKDYEGEFFNNVTQVFEQKPREYAKEFYKRLFPCGDNLEMYKAKIEKLLENCPPNQETLKKFLMESLDTLERRLKTYQVATKN